MNLIVQEKVEVGKAGSSEKLALLIGMCGLARVYAGALSLQTSIARAVAIMSYFSEMFFFLLSGDNVVPVVRVGAIIYCTLMMFILFWGGNAEKDVQREKVD